MEAKPNMAVIGAGYVGLISSACFAELGFKVICVEKDENKVKRLKKGESPIYEPGLSKLIENNLSCQRLIFKNSLIEAVLTSDVLFITVGTLITKELKTDFSALEDVILTIAPFLNSYKVIVIKSTVEVGTCRRLGKKIYEINSKAQFDIVANPEFLRAGSAIKDFMEPDRLVLGVESNRAYRIMIQIYEYFIHKKIPVIYAKLEEAELIKYASNCFLAMKIGFANEMAYLCEHLRADVDIVLHGMSIDSRIGKSYLKPGPGIGGSCLSKDALALVRTAQEVDAPVSIIEAVLKSNIQHKDRLYEKIVRACNGSVNNKHLAVLGVAFKANTDDIHESTSITIISQLQRQGAILRVYDPVVKYIAGDDNLNFSMTLNEAIENADAIIIMTEWEEFRKLNLVEIKQLLRNIVLPPTLIDLRNLFDPEVVVEAGFRYFSLCREEHVSNNNGILLNQAYLCKADPVSELV